MTDAYAAYIAGLPKILASAAMLLRDDAGRVLLVEPNYRDDGTWTLPGGTVESGDGETPRCGARRETAEEIGLDVEPGALLAVDWSSGPNRPPIAMYLYDGGVLGEERLAGIRLQKSELDSWRMVTPDEADSLLTLGAARRVRAALAALAAGTGPVELENGFPAGCAPSGSGRSGAQRGAGPGR